MSSPSFDQILLTRPSAGVVHVQLNRPKALNALGPVLWKSIGAVFQYLSEDQDCRVIVLSGAGRSFSVGLDLKDNLFTRENFLSPDDERDPARKSRHLLVHIRELQDCVSAIENCSKPVIAAVHGHCLGGGVDLISAADVRLASADALFSIKEVDVGLAADVGTLQRLPHIVGNHSWLREVAFTARTFDAKEAKEYNVLSTVYPNQQTLLEAALKLAETIARKSPVAVQGTKRFLLHARDNAVKDSIEYAAIWNMSQLLTSDVPASIMASMSKEQAVYSKL